MLLLIAALLLQETSSDTSERFSQTQAAAASAAPWLCSPTSGKETLVQRTLLPSVLGAFPPFSLSSNHDLAASLPLRAWARPWRGAGEVLSNVTGSPCPGLFCRTLTVFLWNMPCSRGCSILSLLHFVFILAGGHKELSDTLLSLLADRGQCDAWEFEAEFAEVLSFCFAGPDRSVVHPVKTSADGEFISNEVSHHFNVGRHRRDLQGQPPQSQVYYQLSYKGRTLKFNLTANKHLISSDYVLEKRKDNATEHRSVQRNSCHLIGTVEVSGVRGTAAISTCAGLVRSEPLKERLSGKVLAHSSGGHLHREVGTWLQQSSNPSAWQCAAC